MTDSGASVVRGSGDHERDPDGRAGEVSGIRSDRSQLLQVRAVLADDERPALLVLGAVRPAAGMQDALEVRGLERAVGEPADHAPRPDRVPDGVARVAGVAQPRPGSSAAGGTPGSRFPATSGAGHSRGARQGDLGEGPEAARRRVDGREARLAVRDALGLGGGREPRRLVRVQRAAQGRREEPGDRRAIGRLLVQPRVLAADDRQRLDGRVTRAATGARGRRRGGAM